MTRPEAVLLVALSLMAAGAPAETRNNPDAENVRARIIGTWKLFSTEEAMADGSKRPYSDVGPNGKGYLIYTADGHMCAAGMNPDRPAWSDINKPTDAEKLRAMEGFFGYCGRYEIDQVARAIYHYPDVAMDPNFVGTKQKRPYTFDGDMLTFSDTDTTPGVKGYVITWKKGEMNLTAIAKTRISTA